MADGEVYVTFGADASDLNQAFADIRQNSAELNGQMVQVARVMDDTGRVAEVSMGRGLQVASDQLRNLHTQHLAVIEGVKGVDLSLQQSVASHARAAEAVRQQSEAAREGVSSLDQLKSSVIRLAEVAGVSFSAKAIKDWVEETVKAGDALDQQAARYGVSLQDIQQLHGMAAISGASGTDLVSSLSGLETKLRGSADDAEKTANAFKAIGLSFDDMKNKSPLALLEAIAGAMSHYADGANKTAVANQLGGEALVAMVRSLDMGKQGLQELEDAALRAGGAMSDSTIAGLAQMQRDLNEMRLAWNSTIFAGMVPAIDVGVRAFNHFVEAIDPSKIQSALVGIIGEFINFGGKIAEVITLAQTKWDEFIDHFSKNMPEVYGAVKNAVDKTVDIMNRISHGDNSFLDPLIDPLQSKLSALLEKVGLTARDAGASGSAAFGSLSVDAANTHAALEKVRDATKATREEFERLAGVHSSAHSDAAMGGTSYYGNAAVRPGSPKGPQAGVIPADSSNSSGKSDAAQLVRATFDSEAQAAREAADATQTTLDGLLKTHAITMDQWLAQSVAALDKEQDAIQDAADKAMASDDLNEAQKLQLATREEAQLAAIAKKIAEDQNKAAEDTQKKWDAAFTAINGAFDAQVNGLLRGTTSWAQAFKNVLASLTEDIIKFFLDWGLKAGERLIEDQVMNATRVTAHVAGNAAITASDASASAAGALAWVGAAIKSIMASAAETFAGVFGFLAPVMGPAAAGPAAAAGATVSAAIGSVASADIGMWQVPGDQLMMVHRNELIMPAPESGAFRSMLSNAANSGGGAGGAGGGYTHNGDIISNAADARQVAREVASLWNRNPSMRPAY